MLAKLVLIYKGHRLIGHSNIVLILLYIENSQLCKSRVMKVDWLLSESNEKATLNIFMPY